MEDILVANRDEFENYLDSIEWEDFDNCGISGKYVGQLWYVVTLSDGTEQNVYIK